MEANNSYFNNTRSGRNWREERKPKLQIMLLLKFQSDGIEALGLIYSFKFSTFLRK